MKEEINLLKRALSEQDNRLTQLYTDVGSSVMSIQRLQHQQKHISLPTGVKPPILSSSSEERTQKEREAFLDQTIDMTTYWNIPEEEGLDEGEVELEEAELGDELDPSDSHIMTPLPNIPPPDETVSIDLLTHSTSQTSFHSENETAPFNENGSTPGSIPPQMHLENVSHSENSTSSKRKDSVSKRKSSSTAMTPSEPGSSRRNTHRPSFMSMRRKLSAVSTVSQPGELTAPPIKTRTSLVKTIPKADSTVNASFSNFVTVSQLQEFRQERIAVEHELRNRLKSVEPTAAQVHTLHEALKVLSEEIRVTSEELTGQMKSDILDLREGQLKGFQEVFKIVEHCFTQVKQLQANQSKSKGTANSASFGVESLHHEIRILQQNMEVGGF